MVEIFLTILTVLACTAVVGTIVSIGIAGAVCVIKDVFKRERDKWWF